MTKRNQIYKCFVCGNIVEVTHAGEGELVCCNQKMNVMQVNFQDASLEKHVPVVKEKEGKILVQVGEVLHPMEDDHYIEWIELETEDKVYRQNLKPGMEPKAEFALIEGDYVVRAYCNLHGLWQSK